VRQLGHTRPQEHASLWQTWLNLAMIVLSYRQVIRVGVLPSWNEGLCLDCFLSLAEQPLMKVRGSGYATNLAALGGAVAFAFAHISLPAGQYTREPACWTIHSRLG
jgi:hypothetical protein